MCVPENFDSIRLTRVWTAYIFYW